MASKLSEGPIYVPDVAGMLFHVGRDRAAELGLVLANPDPDGPPIGSLAWPGMFVITTQDPAPGTPAHQGDSIRVTVVRDDGTRESEPAQRPSVPPHLATSAEPGDSES